MRDNNRLKRRKALNLDSLTTTKNYLEDMARAGWMFECVSGMNLFEFVKCEPQEITFAVEVLPDGSMFDTHPTDKNMEYIEFCKNVGWNYICSSANVYFFYTTKKDVLPIETDEELKFKTVKKAIFKSKGISAIMVLFTSILQLSMKFTPNLNDVESSFLSFSTTILWIILFFQNLAVLINMGRWVYKAKKVIAEGGKMPERKKLSFVIIIIIFGTLGIIYNISSMYFTLKYEGEIDFTVPIMSLIAIVLFIIIKIAEHYAEKKKIGRNNNLVIQMIIIPIVFYQLFFVMMLFYIGITSDNDVKNVPITDEEAKAFGYSKDYSYRKVDLVDQNRFLLEIDNIYITAYNDDAKEMIKKESETESIEKESASLTYEWDIYIYKTDIAMIHKRILRELSKEKNYQINFNIDEATKTEVDEVTIYEKKNNSHGYRYLIYDEDAIIQMETDVEPLSDEQLDLIIKKFM